MLQLSIRGNDPPQSPKNAKSLYAGFWDFTLSLQDFTAKYSLIGTPILMRGHGYISKKFCTARLQEHLSRYGL